MRKDYSRVKAIQRQLFEQWAVLETLTPGEYAQFRDVLGPSSGLQSRQYRAIEFLLGNKQEEMLELFAHDVEAFRELSAILHSPSLYDEFRAISQDRATPSQRDASSEIGHSRINARRLSFRYFNAFTSIRKHIGRLTPCAKNSSISTNISNSGASAI